MHLNIYEIEPAYIDFLCEHEKHIYYNKKNQKHSRKYVGIVLTINEMKYFAPLSSFKDKHKSMKDTIDFIKLKEYGVINLNNMVPVMPNLYRPVVFSKETDERYRNFLRAEYRVIKKIKTRIVKNAKEVYAHKINKGDTTNLGKRCNDFKKLEKLCLAYCEDKRDKI